MERDTHGKNWRLTSVDRGLQVARATLLTRESDYAAGLAELEPRPAAGENGASADTPLDSIALAEKGRFLSSSTAMATFPYTWGSAS
jgi:hypothetical protein